MNKLEMIEALRKNAGISKSYAKSVVDLFFDDTATTLVKGDRIEIRGLCSFFVKKYKPYTGRNPKTGESVQISAKKLPFFKCGRELRDRVNPVLK